MSTKIHAGEPLGGNYPPGEETIAEYKQAAEHRRRCGGPSWIRERVVVVGGGFGGLTATRALADADVDVTVVDRTNHHLFQPLLYQVAAGILSPGLIAPALRSVIKKQRNARALLADVYDLDLDAQGGARARPGRPRRWTCPTTRWSWRPGPPTPTSARTSSPSSPRA